MVEGVVSCQPWQAGISCREFSVERLRALVQAGVTLAEILPMDVMQLPADGRAARFREIERNVREAGMGVWSVHIPFGGDWDISATDEAKRSAAVEHVRGMIELCQMLRPRKAIIHPSAEPIADAERPARIQASRRSLKQLVKDFAAIPARAPAPVQLAVENLPRTCLGNTAEELLELADGITGLGICFDTNHLLKQTHEQFLAKVAGRIVSMHCSDYDGVDERHWMPGEGMVPWKLVKETLSEVGYAGPFVFETWKHKSGVAVEPGEYVKVLREVVDSAIASGAERAFK